MKSSDRTRREIETEAIVRAWKDDAFRKKLVEDPKAALKELGYEVPDKLTVHTRQEEANEWTIVLPRTPSTMGELQESELLDIAGGNLLLGRTIHVECP